jgi:hypothetical protein
MPTFRTPYDEGYEPSEFGLSTSTEGGAQQQFKDECDVNLIVPRYMRDGIPPAFMKEGEPVFDEFGYAFEVADYRKNLDTLIAAQEAFDALPAKTRKYYDNDPLKLLEAVQNGDQSAYDLGLLVKPEPAPEPTPVPLSGEPKAGA